MPIEWIDLNTGTADEPIYPIIAFDHEVPVQYDMPVQARIRGRVKYVEIRHGESGRKFLCQVEVREVGLAPEVATP